MNSRLLIFVDGLAKPFYFILSALKWKHNKEVENKSYVVLKFFGIGSLTRIAKVMAQTGIEKSAVTFITLDKNRSLISLLGLQAKYIKTNNPFSFFQSSIIAIFSTWKMKACSVLDMERASNLSGIFRLIVSFGKASSTFTFKPNNYSKKGQTFISLQHKRTINAIAEMFGKTYQCESVISALTPVKNRIIVNVNAGDYLPERKFTVSEYCKMIKSLSSHYPQWQIELSGIKCELTYVKAFKSRLIAEGVPLDMVRIIAGKYDLASFSNRLKTAELFITNDSGPLHLANYYGVKTVGIWGPTSPELVGYTNSTTMLNLWTKMPCSPCFLHPKSRVARSCNGELTCFKSMNPEEMAAKISSFVETI